MTDLALAARCLALDAAAVSTVDALAAAGIASVLLKGPAVARRLYPDDPGSRSYSDVDLLVAPASFAAAERALAALGCTEAIPGIGAKEGLWHERGWRLPGAVRLTVDLHRSYAGVGNSDAFWAAVVSTSLPLPLAGGWVDVPGDDVAALLLALHAAAPGSSGKPRRELDRALEVVPEQHWQDAAALARRCLAESAYAVGLRLAPAGAALADRLALPVAGTTVEWLNAHPGSTAAHGWARVAAARTGRMGMLRRTLWPSAGLLRYYSPLARRGPGGLALAYLARLARLGLATPRGLYELRAASRRSRGALPLHVHMSRTGVPALRAGIWALRAQRSVRRQLVRGGLDAVLPAPPPAGRGARRAVATVLRRTGASCLEGSLVRQRWLVAQGSAPELVIGVTAPGAGFHAHAWLAGETTAEHHGMVELLRRPAALPTPR